MDASAPRARSVALLLLLLTLACVAVTVALFERAYPLLDTGGRIDRADALARARAFVEAERLAPADARTAVRFGTDDELTTYVDLAGGGPDSLRTLARSGDVAVAWWSVRFFRPGDPREVRVRLDARDGRVAGVDRTLAEADRRPTVGPAEARATADRALGRWGGRDVRSWRVVSGPVPAVQPVSGRVDYTVTYEHTTRRVGGAPLRADVVVTGADSAAGGAVPGAAAAAGAALDVRPYVQIPETFERRYAEMRSANDLFAYVSTPLTLLYIIAGVVAVVQLRKRDLLRLRPAVIVGGTVGVLLALATLNTLPTSWYGYDTALPPAVHVAGLVFGSVLAGMGAGILVTAMVAAAEGLTRLAFPDHWDWYAFWRHRGTRQVAGRVLGGYALCALGFAYVTLFYLAMRRGFGWWVPTSALDDPNQIATPLPWVSALGIALFAGIWEEAAFRAIPLALLALWLRGRPHRRAWMTAGVVVTALVFGFGHANYPSWPPYSRGVELFLEAALWAALYLTVGLPTTIVAHVAYDLTWFGLFAAQGQTLAYRVTLAIVGVALFVPALAVLQRWLAQGGRWADAPDTARLAAWRQRDRALLVDDAPPPARLERLTPAARRVAVGLAAAALVLAVAWRPPRLHGSAFTASRARVAQAADSALRARGEDPARWRRLLSAESHGLAASTRRFFDGERARDRAVALAGTYLPVAWWEARYVRTAGTLAARGEEWTVRVLPDGRALDVSRRVPEARPGAKPDTTAARALARAALPAFVPGAERARLREVELTQTPTPDTTRLDTRVTYEDEGARLPAGARARVIVHLAGDTARAGTRDVQLPETFVRADRGESGRRGVAAAVGGVLAFALLVWLLVGAMRRAPAPGAAGEPWIDRPRGLAVAGFAAVAMAASNAMSLPSTLASWSTATPWSNFLALQVVQLLILALVFGAIFLGLWYLADGLRRRAGVPVWPAGADGARDALVAGGALGLGATAAQYAMRSLGAVQWPVPPETAQGELAPWLAGASAVVMAAATSAAVTIPAAALALGVRRWGARILVLLLAAACTVPVAQLAGTATASGTGATVLAVAGALFVGAVTVLLVRAYGAHSGVAWGHAALLGALATQLAAARAAASPVDRASAAVGALTAAALVALLHRAASRHAARGAPAAAPPDADLARPPVADAAQVA